MIKKDVAMSESGFLFDPATGSSFNLNPTGVQIVKAFQEGKSTDEVAVMLVERYGIETSQALKDLYDFEQVLTQYKLSNNG